MDWTFLSFLASSWFVISWYAVGVLGAAFVAFDITKHNTPLKTAMKWAWPIIVVFFSVLGLALYFGTARAPGIADATTDDEKQRKHRAYEQNILRRVNGAVIHCVAGDGLGIMTAMVIARAFRFAFWHEFWFEYAVGFAFGWFIFQLKSMTMMTDSKSKALAMAFRAEFFSMLTVMAGMGAVMAYVTPLAVTAQPRPLTFAFWGFGALGLLVGYIATYPMNFMMVKIGWKHGMGSPEDSRPVEGRAPRFGLLGAMVVLGIGALIVPGVLDQLRIHGKVTVTNAPIASASGASVSSGLHQVVTAAASELEAGRSTRAIKEVDAAYRVAEVVHEAVPETRAADALVAMKQARKALWMGRRRAAIAHLQTAAANAAQPPGTSQASPTSLSRYAGAALLDRDGNVIGEVEGVHGEQVVLAVGGIRDFWGFWDLSEAHEVTVSAADLVFGPVRTVGWSYVAYPAAD